MKGSETNNYISISRFNVCSNLSNIKKNKTNKSSLICSKKMKDNNGK